MSKEGECHDCPERHHQLRCRGRARGHHFDSGGEHLQRRQPAVLDRIGSPKVAESLSLKPRAFAASDLPALGAGRVRIVVSDDLRRPGRRSRRQVGASSEAGDASSGRRSSRGGSGTAPIGRRRACTHAHAPGPVNGEEVTASLAPPWHAKNLTGNGVKVAIIDGGFVDLPSDRRRRPAFERDHAGHLRRPVQHRDGARDGSRRDRPRDGAGSAALPHLRRHRARSSRRRGHAKARAPASSATPPRGSGRGAMAAA